MPAPPGFPAYCARVAWWHGSCGPCVAVRALSPALLAVSLLLSSGCRCDPHPPGDPCRVGSCFGDAWCDPGLGCRPCPGGPECRSDGGAVDGGGADAGPRPDAAALTCDERRLGSACASACVASECQAERVGDRYPTTRVDGTEGRGLALFAFPGGYCGDTCDATRVNDPCGPCATCSGELLAGRTRWPLAYVYVLGGDRTAGVCRADCVPSATGSGCAREGYTCDLQTSTCMEACRDDVQCQVAYEDIDGDDYPELVDRGETSGAYCDRVTGRCRTRGRPGAAIGDRCEQDRDCPEDGVCLRGEAFPDGYCTQLGCGNPGFECPAGTACDVRNLGVAGCAVTCRIGAEDGTPGMLGAATGGHPDCGLGYGCFWNGSSEPGDEALGSCLPGEYNDRRSPNVGAACGADAECYSPFGYGECLYRWLPGTASGMCSVGSCGTFVGADGEVVDGLLGNVEVGSPVCDSARGEVCINLAARASPPRTQCLRRCEDASTCGAGFACAEILSGARFCWPLCYGDEDCRSGARCRTEAGEPCATGFEDYCYCG